jgi:mannose-6-phosphate isomerase
MEPVYKDYIWGGHKLKNELNKNTPYERTAESWEISSNSNGVCSIINEEYKGETLETLFSNETLKESIFGKKSNNFKKFPILIKFIDAKDNLSIQVHPDDEYALKNGLESGKDEMWYIMDCKPNAKLVGGFVEKTLQEQVKEIVENDKIQDYINYIEIRPGDVISIPAGTLHAILKDILLCEIQQNCDITYRVYDWDRKDKDGNGRTLHKSQAIETIKVENVPVAVSTNNSKEKQKIATNKIFEVEKIKCTDTFEDESSSDTFYAINVVNGEGKLITPNKEYNIKKGDSFLIPATLGKYSITGNLEFLKSYIV